MADIPKAKDRRGQTGSRRDGAQREGRIDPFTARLLAGQALEQRAREAVLGRTRERLAGRGSRRSGASRAIAGTRNTKLDRLAESAKSNPGVAAALSEFDADLRPGTRLGNSGFLDAIRKANAAAPNQISIDRTNKFAGLQKSGGKSGGGGSKGGGQTDTSRGGSFSQRRDLDRMLERRKQDERERMRFEAELRKEELRDRLALLQSALGSRSNDNLTSTRQEFINIAGRPELRTTKNTEQVDRTASILRALGL